MKILLPENIEDITLSQFQILEQLNEKLENKEIDLITYNKRKINLFTAIPIKQIESVAHKDIAEIQSQIDLAITQDVEFKDRFTMDGVEYGFIPNFDNISQGEFIDLDKYGTDVETLHNLMAILFRPIVNKSMGTYSISDYNGTSEYAEKMKQTPLNIVNGALSFFFHLSSELENYILKCTREARMKAQRQETILKNGGGMQHLTN